MRNNYIVDGSQVAAVVLGTLAAVVLMASTALFFLIKKGVLKIHLKDNTNRGENNLGYDMAAHPVEEHRITT